MAATFYRRRYQAAWVAQKRATQRQTASLPAAVRDSLDYCPTCGVPWPEDVPPSELTPCELLPEERQ